MYAVKNTKFLHNWLPQSFFQSGNESDVTKLTIQEPTNCIVDLCMQHQQCHPHGHDEKVSAHIQQQQLHEHGRGSVLAQNHQRQPHRHDVGDVLYKNHQYQLCELALQNVSVQNHPWQSHSLVVGASLSQKLQQRPSILNLAELVPEGGHGVRDVSAQNHKRQFCELDLEDVSVQNQQLAVLDLAKLM
jgi:hypothetical protein